MTFEARERTSADFQHVGLDDGADVEPVALRDIGIGNAPAPVFAFANAGKAVVGLERIAAGGDEIDHGVEVCARQCGVGGGSRHLGIEFVAEERLAAGAAEDVLREHVERTDAQWRRILRVLGDSVERGAALEHFETVGRNEHAFRRFVHAVIGAADALENARSAFRRADIDHQIDVAPVDAEIERRGANHSAQPAARHRRFDLAALRNVERTVMQRDGQIVVIDVPELLKDRFRLAAGVDENQRSLMRHDETVDFIERVPRRVPGPGQPLARVEHGDVGRRARVGYDEIGDHLPRRAAALRHHETRELSGLGHGRRETDAGEVFRNAKQASEAERKQVAALRRDQRMQLIEDHALERAEQIRRVRGRKQQRQLLRRRQQNLRRIAALALAF